MTRFTGFLWLNPAGRNSSAHPTGVPELGDRRVVCKERSALLLRVVFVEWSLPHLER
jgi:hypothetical protein